MISLVAARRKARRLPRMPRVSDDYFPFGPRGRKPSGLNQIDSPLNVTPGQVQNALNYEMGFDGGYRRIGGYESFDGSPSASEATYEILKYGATERLGLTLGDQVDGDTSSANAQYLTHTESGGYGVNYLESNQAFDSADYTITGQPWRLSTETSCAPAIGQTR